MMNRRSLISISLSLGMFVLQALNSNFGFAIIDMTTKRDIQLKNGTIIQEAEFQWNPITIGYIYSSRAYGALVSGFVGAILCSRFGGVAIFGLSLISCSIINLITPMSTYAGLYAIIILNATKGFLADLSRPCIPAIVSRWAPPNERARMISITTIGTDISHVASLTLYGNLAFYYGWRCLFYLPGICGIIWSFLWFCTVKDHPEDDRKIKEKELAYLQGCLGEKETEPIKHPWLAMMTSLPLWALIFLRITTRWGYIAVHDILPLFSRDILNLNVKEIGYVASSPYAVVIIVTLLAAILSDYMIKRNWFSITTTRKIFTVVGAIVHGVPVFLIPFSNSPQILSLWLILTTAGGGITSSSVGANMIDIAPRHACVISGIVRTIMAIFSILCPIITGYIVANKTREEWIIVFWVTGIIYFLGGTVFLFFGSADVQPWAVPYKISENNAEKCVPLENEDTQM